MLAGDVEADDTWDEETLNFFPCSIEPPETTNSSFQVCNGFTAIGGQILYRYMFVQTHSCRFS